MAPQFARRGPPLTFMSGLTTARDNLPAHTIRAQAIGEKQ